MGTTSDKRTSLMGVLTTVTVALAALGLKAPGRDMDGSETHVLGIGGVRDVLMVVKPKKAFCRPPSASGAGAPGLLWMGSMVFLTDLFRPGQSRGCCWCALRMDSPQVEGQPQCPGRGSCCHGLVFRHAPSGPRANRLGGGGRDLFRLDRGPAGTGFGGAVDSEVIERPDTLLVRVGLQCPTDARSSRRGWRNPDHAHRNGNRRGGHALGSRTAWDSFS